MRDDQWTRFKNLLEKEKLSREEHTELHTLSNLLAPGEAAAVAPPETAVGSTIYFEPNRIVTHYIGTFALTEADPSFLRGRDTILPAPEALKEPLLALWKDGIKCYHQAVNWFGPYLVRTSGFRHATALMGNPPREGLLTFLSPEGPVVTASIGWKGPHAHWDAEQTDLHLAALGRILTPQPNDDR